MINQIWEILTTLTEEAQRKSIEKATELGFDINRGIVSLDESFMNLNNSKLLLVDAIEKKKLIQLPITLQQVFLKNLISISESLTGLINGKDAVVNLANNIEALNTSIWQYGLYNLSPEILGYQTKMSQLKEQELRLKALTSELQKGLDLKANLDSLRNSVEESFKTVTSMTEAINKSEQESKTILSSIVSTHTECNSTLADLTQTNTTSKELQSEIKDVKAQVTAWANDIEIFSNELSSTKTFLAENSSKLSLLIKSTEETHQQIEALLPNATSAGLASAFKQRKDDIAKSKNFWRGGFIVSVSVLLVLVVWMIYSFNQNVNHVEWLIFLLQRAPVSFPLIWLGWFFSRNYGHMVRLEEDYAFKQAISQSFEGYKNQMKAVSPETGLPNLCENVIKILSDSPLRIYDRKTSDETPANSVLEKLIPNKKSPVQE